MELDILGEKINNIFSQYGPIEKKIHISWKNKNIIEKNYNIIKNGILQVKQLNPDYEFTISDDNDIDEYLQKHISEEDYNLIKDRKIVEKTDLWRLIKIYNEGGVYLDIDRFCNIPFSDIIKSHTKCILPMYYDRDFAQDFLCSCSKNIIFKRAIELNLERRKGGSTDIMYLGPNTYFNAATEILLGRQLNRDPEKSEIFLLRILIANSPFLESFREDPPYHTTIYIGPHIHFDKDVMYKNEQVKAWGEL